MMGRNLLIHNPTNEYTKYYRDYNLFWDQLTDELKKENKVIENRYFKEAHISRSKIYLKRRTKEYLELLECEYVIEDMDTGEFWILSVSEQISSCILDEKDNPYLQKVLYSQYIPDQIVHHVGENFSKYDPWIFFPQSTVDLEPYYIKRSEKKEFIEKLFFKGKTDYRPIVNHIDKSILSPNKMVLNHHYFNELIDYEICLSIGGTANGDLCYRDIECMALGIPFLRFDFVTTLNPPLIPNYHYISIPIQLDFPIVNDVLKDRLGNSEHAKLIEDKFHKIINNKNLLRYISENSRNYYESYLSPTARIKHTLNLLNHLK